jgi:hypothetical protein
MATKLPERSCPVCGAKHHRLLALCAVHERRLERTGNPEGFAVRSSELKYYRPIARGLMHKYENDPAIAAGHTLMNSILTGYGADCEAATPGRKMRPHLDNLVNAGATARSSLVELLALAMWWKCEERMPSAVEMDSQMVSRLLQHKRGGGQRSNGVLRRQVIASLGYRLRCDLCPLLFQICAHWSKSLAAHEVQRKATLTFSPTF